jgi:hypothetical protein
MAGRRNGWEVAKTKSRERQYYRQTGPCPARDPATDQDRRPHHHHHHRLTADDPRQPRHDQKR